MPLVKAAAPQNEDTRGRLLLRLDGGVIEKTAAADEISFSAGLRSPPLSTLSPDSNPGSEFKKPMNR